jgi:hypothetical protein
MATAMKAPHNMKMLSGEVTVLVLFSLLVSPPSFCQEHAPSVEECRADAAVWSAKDADINTPSNKELWARVHEMNQCLEVDSRENAHDSFFKYVLVCNEVEREYSRRVLDFLNRHNSNWKQQFDAEDAAGKR